MAAPPKKLPPKAAPKLAAARKLSAAQRTPAQKALVKAAKPMAQARPGGPARPGGAVFNPAGRPVPGKGPGGAGPPGLTKPRPLAVVRKLAAGQRTKAEKILVQNAAHSNIGAGPAGLRKLKPIPGFKSPPGVSLAKGKKGTGIATIGGLKKVGKKLGAGQIQIAGKVFNKKHLAGASTLLQKKGQNLGTYLEKHPQKAAKVGVTVQQGKNLQQKLGHQFSTAYAARQYNVRRFRSKPGGS